LQKERADAETKDASCWFLSLVGGRDTAFFRGTDGTRTEKIENSRRRRERKEINNQVRESARVEPKFAMI